MDQDKLLNYYFSNTNIGYSVVHLLFRLQKNSPDVCYRLINLHSIPTAPIYP